MNEEFYVQFSNATLPRGQQDRARDMVQARTLQLAGGLGELRDHWRNSEHIGPGNKFERIFNQAVKDTHDDLMISPSARRYTVAKPVWE